MNIKKQRLKRQHFGDYVVYVVVYVVYYTSLLRSQKTSDFCVLTEKILFNKSGFSCFRQLFFIEFLSLQSTVLIPPTNILASDLV